MDVLSRLKKVEGSTLHGRVLQSIQVIQRSIDLYGTSGLALSLNGGKDSTVLLHLIRAALERGQEESDTTPDGLGGMVTFFFDKPDDFPEVVEFTKEIDAMYSLHMKIYTSDFFTGLKDLLDTTPIKAIFLGTRKGDPNAGDQQIFSPSSPGWPVFMRINPIMDWSYHDVWEFLTLCDLPYCCLYDRGYTSLGSVDKTFPNAALARADGYFSPAHMLQDPKLERSGRVSGPLLREDSFHRHIHTPSAGIVIIGDEILAAKVDDMNMRFLCKNLRAVGWHVSHVYFVGDDVEAISNAITDLSMKCDAVMTSGGLGPTLDDVTIKAVAKAIGRKIVKSAKLEERIRSHFGDHVTEHHLKMAEVPDGPETVLIEYNLQDGRPSPYPLVRCRNVYILPGVPSIVEQKWPAIRSNLADLPIGENIERKATEELPFSSVIIRLQVSDEASISSHLEAVRDRFGNHVAIASYPLTDQSDSCSVALSLESKDEAVLTDAHKHLSLLLQDSTCTILSEHKNKDDALSSPACAPTLGISD